MLMALDEVTQICPVPLPAWMADSAGKGILMVAICHGLAQLEARWDSAGARSIWDTAGIKVILGGVADPDTFDRLSLLCGEIALRTHSRTRGEDGRRARTVTYQPVQVLPPELLRMLPEWRALIVRGNLFPVVVRLRMAWRRQDYRRACRASGAPRRLLSAEAVDRPEDWVEPSPDDALIPLPADEVPDWMIPPEQASPPSLPGEHRPPRPRRPWDPPVDSRDRR